MRAWTSEYRMTLTLTLTLALPLTWTSEYRMTAELVPCHEAA